MLSLAWLWPNSNHTPSEANTSEKFPSHTNGKNEGRWLLKFEVILIGVWLLLWNHCKCSNFMLRAWAVNNQVVHFACMQVLANECCWFITHEQRKLTFISMLHFHSILNFSVAECILSWQHCWSCDMEHVSGLGKLSFANTRNVIWDKLMGFWDTKIFPFRMFAQMHA